jgi:predicted NAD-dependent protein-ADP-ribosyltransferase YbiA (DUF1768 family)
MTIFFYSTKGSHGCFSNFSQHGFEPDGMYWLLRSDWEEVKDEIVLCCAAQVRDPCRHSRRIVGDGFRRAD